MNELETYWFHCGQCGKLYSSEVDFSEDRVCPHCGGNPSPSAAAAPPAQDAKVHQQPLESAQAQSAHWRRPRRLRSIHKVLIVWLVLMAAIFGVASWVKQRNQTPTAVQKQGKPGQTQPVAPNADQQFVREMLPECIETLAAYLRSESIAQRLPLVLPHPEIEERMENYFQDNKLLNADPDTLTLTASTLVHLPEGRTILTQWETPEGATFDAAFRKANHKWLLDWHHFVRYSDLAWALFLAGSGDEVAEFRLHARRRLASKGDPRSGIGVVLSSPLRRHMDQVGYKQSMMGLSLDDEDGRLLERAFDREAGGFPLFGAEVRDINPEGMIRVRVRVERIGQEGGFNYRIVEVIACHWYDSAATGLETVVRH